MGGLRKRQAYRRRLCAPVVCCILLRQMRWYIRRCSVNRYGCRWLVATDADVATVTFQNRDTFVEFIVDTVNDLSFSFLPLGVSPSTVDLTLVHQLILLALCDDNNRSMTVYLATDNDNDNDNHLIIERRLHTNTDRLSISLSGAYVVHLCDQVSK